MFLFCSSLSQLKESLIAARKDGLKTLVEAAKALINQNVVRIVDAAQQIDTGVSQTHEASHELARLSESLRELIGNFKV